MFLHESMMKILVLFLANYLAVTSSSYTYISDTTVVSTNVSADGFHNTSLLRCEMNVQDPMYWRKAIVGISFNTSITDFEIQGRKLMLMFADPRAYFYVLMNRWRVRQHRMYFINFLVVHDGDKIPTGVCTLQSRIPYLPGKRQKPQTTPGSNGTASNMTTIAPTTGNQTVTSSPNSLPYSTPIVNTRSWMQNSNLIMEGECVFAVSQQYFPTTQQFNVSLDQNTMNIQEWSGNLKSKDTNGRWYMFTNTYHLQPNKFTMQFQITYSISVPEPNGVCYSSLPPFTSTG